MQPKSICACQCLTGILANKCVCVYVCMSVYVCLYVQSFMYGCLYLCMCTSNAYGVYIYAYIYMCIYVRIYVYTDIIYVSVIHAFVDHHCAGTLLKDIAIVGLWQIHAGTFAFPRLFACCVRKPLHAQRLIYTRLCRRQGNRNKRKRS